MSVLPPPAPLDHPPGDPRAVLDLVCDLTSAARRLADLAGEVGGAPARAPGWRGDDADAAAARATALAAVAARAGEGLAVAAARLAEHAERWQDVRRRLQVLRAEQEDDFAVARARVATPVDPAGWTADGPVAALEELAAAERVRRRVHAALLADLSDDAAATGRVLAGATAGIDGGVGSRSEAVTLRHLAGELPDWARGELAVRGRELARRFLDEALEPGQVEELAREAAHLAGLPGFAAGFFRSAGHTGTALLFERIGRGHVRPEGALTELLARALSALDRDGAGGPDDLLAPAGAGDGTVVGAAAVLALGAARGLAGPPPPVLAGWGRDLLARERLRGERWSVGARPVGMAPTTADPLALVVGALVAQRAGAAAVQLLASDDAWPGVLHRAWDDQGVLLGELVALAGSEDTAAAGGVLRGALVELGTGLVDGDPDGWTVNRAVVEAVSPALSAGLVGHLPELTGLLMVGVHGLASEGTTRALHGLGYVSVVPAGAATIEGALRDWRSEQARGLDPRGAGEALPAVAVPAAFLAVREFGQRLLHVIECLDRQDLAQRRHAVWEATVGLASQVAGGRVPLLGQLLGAAETVLQRTVGWDGRYRNGPDHGLRFDAASAAAEALAGLDTPDRASAEAVAREAAMGFGRAAAVVQVMAPPRPPDGTWLDAVLDGVGMPGTRGGRAPTSPAGSPWSGRPSVPGLPGPPTGPGD